jgi:hypothetical protein
MATTSRLAAPAAAAQEKEKQALVWQEGHKRGRGPHQSKSKTCNGVNPLI